MAAQAAIRGRRARARFVLAGKLQGRGGHRIRVLRYDGRALQALGGDAGIVSFARRGVAIPQIIWCHLRRAGVHAVRLISMPIELLTRERRLDKEILLQRTGLFPLRWRTVVRRHDDSGGGRGRGGHGVGVHLVDARKLQKGLHRLGRGSVVRLELRLQRAQWIQRGVRARQWRPALCRNDGQGRVRGELRWVPLDVALA